MEEEGRILFRYCGPDGGMEEKTNPNGSVNHIAGIINKEKK